MAKIMGNPTVTPTNIPANIPANISVWQPNTVYKKGQWVFVRDDGNGFTLVTLYECSRDHVSGDTFTLTDGWGGRSLKANIALNDYLGNSIHGTYAKKNELTAVEAIAKGRATGYVFDTKADMDAWLANSENTESLVLGDNFYIIDTDVPDYWWDGSSAQQLETQKVDLTEYAKTEDVANLQEQVDENADEIAEIESGLWNKIEYWRPNTEYKAGQYVLGSGVSPNQPSDILYCLQDHVSGVTPTAGGQYWGAHYFRATEAKCDMQSNVIHTTYATKEEVLPKIEAWQPSTEYKVGQHVLATVKGLAPAAFSGIMRCIKEHASGATFPQTSDPAYGEYVNDYWELSDVVNANTAAFASQASMAYNAMYDIVGNYIVDTYATKEELANTEAIAKGRATGYVFETYDAMTAWLANSENTANLVLGDNLYIRATDIPDYWWDGNTAQQLETQKVDLTEYVTTADLTAAIGEALEGEY